MRRYLLLCFILLCFSVSVFAQERAQPPLEESKALKRLEAIKIWKLTEVLDLNEIQSEKFFPKLRKLEKQKRDTFKERGKLLKELKELLLAQASEKDIQKGIEKIIDFDKKKRKEEEKLRKEVMSVLSVKQQAKLLLFEDRFGEEVKKIIKGLREKRPVGSKHEKRF